MDVFESREHLENELNAYKESLGVKSFDDLKRLCEGIIYDIRRYNHLDDYCESLVTLAENQLCI